MTPANTNTATIAMQTANKTKEQLSSTEERLKQLKLDLQRLQMDLMAKTGECSSAVERVKELEGSAAALKSSNQDLAASLKDTKEQLAAMTAMRDTLQGALQACLPALCIPMC
jgi:chromosome segregation ATPase